MPAADGREGPKRKPPNKINSGKFEVKKRLGAGCFGEVFLGTNTETGEEVAIKTEDVQSSAPQLEHEAETLKILRQPTQPQGFVEYHYFGREGPYQCMVMELLGKSLEDYMQKCNNKFTVKTTALVAEQVLQRIEYLHAKGIVHRDIKPENFMFGTKAKAHVVYLIDFGLSKRYWDKKHALLRQKLSLTGTARYASINAHKGLEQSRRDDLEAIGHMFMYFLRGSLPWSGLDAKSKQEKYQKIMETKEQTPLDDLCDGFPDPFQDYLSYARNLQFMERPNYEKMLGWFRGVRLEQQAKSDHDFQWYEQQEPKDTLIALRPRARFPQPDDPEDPKVGSGRRGWRWCGCFSAGGVKD